jgi:hypothetical protein
MGSAVAIAVMALIIAGQFIIIWQLMNRLLIQAHIPTLTPVRAEPPAEAPPPPVRKKAFSVQMGD